MRGLKIMTATMLKSFALVVLLYMQSAQGSSAIVYNEALRQLNHMNISNYNHTTYVDEELGIYEYDCVGR